MQREVFKRVFRFTADFKQSIGSDLRALQSIGRLAIKQDDGIRAWLRAERRAETLDRLQEPQSVPLRAFDDGGEARLQSHNNTFTNEWNLVIGSTARQFHPR